MPIFGAISGAVMAGDDLRQRAASRADPQLHWRQIHFILAFTALVIAVGYLLVDTGGFDKGIGFWFYLLGAIG